MLSQAYRLIPLFTHLSFRWTVPLILSSCRHIYLFLRDSPLPIHAAWLAVYTAQREKPVPGLRIPRTAYSLLHCQQSLGGFHDESILPLILFKSEV
jgi:hypothetical protein